MNAPGPDVIVVGGGISGLACAWRLHRGGASVLLVERADEVGGVIRSDTLPGAGTVDLGPQTLRSGDPELVEEFRELGIEKDRLVAGGTARNRYVLWNGELIALPLSPPAFLGSPILSFGAKLRLLAEPFRGAQPEQDVSVADFFRHRLGPQVLERLVDPFVSGIYAGDPEQLSMRAVFPALVRGVEEKGSLLRWGLSRARAARKARAPDAPRRRPELFSFREGLGQWPRAVARALGPERVETGVRVRTVRPSGGRWVVEGEAAGAPWSRTAPRVVLALPAAAAAGLLRERFPDRVRRLADIPYAPVATVHLAFRRADVAHPLDGFGCLFPSSQKRPVLGCLWISSLFPERVEDDVVLTTTFVGGARQSAHALRSERWIADQALHEHEAILGARGKPVALRVHRWKTAIPQYDFGHLDRVAAADEIEADAPGLRFTGSWRGGVSVPDCWAHGREAADAILRETERPRSSPVAGSS